MKVLDLFSGIGGFSIGLEKAGFETVAFCEIEEYPRAVLKRHWPDIPIYGDVRELTGKQLRADGIIPDVIVGGYPCPPYSLAGRRRGAEDDRHLWPEVRRLVNEIRPTWCIFENVAGHISMGLDEVLSDLEAEGYAARPFVIPACGVDAPHRRDRVWIVAYSNRNDGGRERSTEPQGRDARLEHGGGSERQSVGQSSQDVAYAKDKRPQGRTKEQVCGVGNISKQSERSREDKQKFWAVEPDIRRVVDGLSDFLDGSGKVSTRPPAKSEKNGRHVRLRALGNAVVPQIPEVIGNIIMQIEGNND